MNQALRILLNELYGWWMRSKRVTASVVPAFVVLPFGDGVACAQWGSCPFGWMGSGMMGGAWGWAGGFFMILFWLLMLVGVVILIRWMASGGDRRLLPPPGGGISGESAMDILKKRYARGELTKEQFESMKRDLEGP